MRILLTLLLSATTLCAQVPHHTQGHSARHAMSLKKNTALEKIQKSIMLWGKSYAADREEFIYAYEDTPLKGSIPKEIGEFTHLKQLSLQRNALKGVIPNEIGKLRHLTSLFISRNGLKGSIPKSLGQLSDLLYLSIDREGMSGHIPAELMNLTKLKQLSLNSNNLNGNIPANIGHLTQLEDLNLSENKLTGAIPASVAKLKKLESFNVSHNNLSGALPDAFQTLPNLTDIYLQDNKNLQGELIVGGHVSEVDISNTKISALVVRKKDNKSVRIFNANAPLDRVESNVRLMDGEKDCVIQMNAQVFQSEKDMTRIRIPEGRVQFVSKTGSVPAFLKKFGITKKSILVINTHGCSVLNSSIRLKYKDEEAGRALFAMIKPPHQEKAVL